MFCNVSLLYRVAIKPRSIYLKWKLKSNNNVVRVICISLPNKKYIGMERY
jgi:hypothetical protein